MHPGAPHQQGDRLWLVSGTGEGPPLALELLKRGWRVRVCVVGSGAALAYPPHPRLELRVGALGGPADLERDLAAASAAGYPLRWVVDATHPFATRISAALAAACGARDQPLLRLLRPLLPPNGAILLSGLESLGEEPLQGRALLLAIGARQLGPALAHSPGAHHHARLLPSAAALAAAMAAGLRPDRVACLRPGADAAVERALCRRWGIETVLCRRSGGRTETLWREVAAAERLQLLLLDRPPEPAAVEALTGPELLARIGAPSRPGPS
jgi:precorrin-6A/cobalt-precorrin-6A reductase